MNQQLEKLLNSCDFIDREYKDELLKRADSLSPDDVAIVMKRVKDAQNHVDSLYISIALQYSPSKLGLIKDTLSAIKIN